MVDRVVGGRVRKVVAGVVPAVGASLALSARRPRPPTRRPARAPTASSATCRRRCATASCCGPTCSPPTRPAVTPWCSCGCRTTRTSRRPTSTPRPAGMRRTATSSSFRTCAGSTGPTATFYTFRNEATDGYDTIEWAARLPKANGRVGMYGFSYPGATQWLPATLRPPHLVTIVPAMTASDYRDGWTYEGGALDLSFAMDWPLTTIANSAVRRYPDGAALDAEMDAAATNEFIKWYWLCRCGRSRRCTPAISASRRTSSTGSPTRATTRTGGSGASAAATGRSPSRR